MRAYKQLKRYEGKSWIWPRVAWVFLITFFGFVVIQEFFKMPDPTTAPTTGEIVATVITIYAYVSFIILVAHFTTIIIIRLNETCVWCRIVQRNPDGSIKATLSVLAYRLPFLDPSRTNSSPWAGDNEAYWKPSGMGRAPGD